MGASRDGLEDRIDDLEAQVQDLRAELVSARRPPLRPPTPGELLRFTEEHTLPTVIASLEATIRALELLRQLLRLTDPARGGHREGRTARDRFPTRRDAVERVDAALADLRRALEGADLPRDETARAIVEDARAVTAEVERLLAESGAADAGTPDGSEAGADADAAPGGRGAEADGEGEASPDVEAELRSIRDELGETGSEERGDE